MHILEALKKGDGKAIRADTPICYVALDGEILKWFEKETEHFHSDVHLITILDNDWEGYTNESVLKFELDKYVNG